MNRFLTDRIKFFVSFICLTIGSWIFVCPLAASDTGISGHRQIKIIVSETNLVSGHEIFLGDIAVIHASSFLKEMLEKIEIGNAPKPGKIKLFNKTRLISLIRSHNGMPDDIEVEAPQSIYVKRASQHIKQQEVRQHVDAFLTDFFKGREYEIEQIRIRDLGVYPIGQVKLSMTSKRGVDKNGNISLSMDILIDGNREDRIKISGKVAVYGDILCATRNLKKGEEILEKDVYFLRKNLFSLRGDVVRSFQEAAGKTSKINIKKDDHLNPSWLQETPLIQKGDIINLVVRRDKLSIVTTGISKEDGYADKVINVENIGSGKIVRGLVRERSTVEVIY